MTGSELRQLAEARSEALAVVLTATAAGVWETTPELLDALAALGLGGSVGSRGSGVIPAGLTPQTVGTSVML